MMKLLKLNTKKNHNGERLQNIRKSMKITI